MWHNLYAKFYTVSQPICRLYKVNSFCSWYWAGVGSSEEEDGRFEGKSILSFIMIFSVLAYFLCIFDQDPLAFKSEFVTSSDETFKSDRYVYGSGRALYFRQICIRNFQLKYIFKKLYNKKMGTFALILI